METEVLEQPIRIIILVFLSICFIITWSTNSALWIYLRSAAGTKASSYIKAVIILTLPAGAISLPLTMVLIGTDIANGSCCRSFYFIAYITFFIPMLMILNVISVMSLVRCLSICNWSRKHLLGYTKSILTCVIIYTSLLSVPVVYELRNYFWSVTPQVNVCEEAYYVEEESLKPPVYIIVSVTFCMIVSSTTIMATTRYLRRVIQKHETNVSGVLQVKRKVETKRIIATQIIWVVFSFFWIPYGILHIVCGFIQLSSYIHCSVILQSVAYASFFTLPIVYYKMDIKYERFIKTIFQKIRNKNTVEPTQTMAVVKLKSAGI